VKRMVIVEGPDGSGKTTLTGQLSEDLGLPVLRHETLSSTEGPTDPAALVKWWRERISKDTPGIYDRCFFISELMYQMVQRGRPLTVLGPQMADGIHDLWVADPILIFCMTDWETEMPQIQSRANLQDVTLEDMYKVSWAYWSIFAMYQEMLTTVAHYDYRREGAYDSLRGYISG